MEADAVSVVTDEYIICNSITAGTPKIDAKPAIITDIVACNNVIVAGTLKVEAIHVVFGDVVVGYGIIAGIPEVDTVMVVAKCIACKCIVAGTLDADTTVVV